MKSILLTVSLFFLASTSHAINTFPAKDPLASEMMIPLAGTGMYTSLENYVTLTPKSYRLITGKKLSLGERIKLNVTQRYLKKMIRKDGTVNTQKLKKYGFFGQWEWHWGGFALGFFLNLVGVIVALFFRDEYKWDRFWTALKTSLIVWAIVSLVLAIAAA